MSIYKLPITDLFNMGTEVFNGVDVGDEIITQGYYHIDDGAGARFRVEQGLAAEGSYFEYTLVNTEEKQFKAVMIIENGTVNIDQLGAKGDAVIPEETDGFTVAYYSQLVSSNINSFDHTNLLIQVLSHTDIHTVVLSEGKNYGVRSCISIYSTNDETKYIIGNKSRIVEIDENILSLFQLFNFAKITVKDVELLKGNGQNGSAAIYFQNNDVSIIENVTVKSLQHGIYSESIPMSHKLIAKNCEIHSLKTGILCFESEGTEILDCTIIGTNSNSEIGVQFLMSNKNATIKRSRFFDLSNAVNLLSNASHDLENCKILEVYAENCQLVLRSKFAKNIFVDSVIARESRQVVFLGDSENIRINNSLFYGVVDSTTACPFTVSSTSSGTVFVSGCKFDYDSKWIKTLSSLIDNKSHFVFSDCLFNLRNATSSELSPVMVEGGSLDADFDNCSFNVENYATPISGSEYMFYFNTASNSNLVHHWNFTNCKFTHGTNYPIKSPILIDSVSDEYEKAFVTVRDCTLKGFEQVMHLKDVTYNETDTIESLFNEKSRFLSTDNLYLFDTLTPGVNTTYYKKAEEYGLS